MRKIFRIGVIIFAILLSFSCKGIEVGLEQTPTLSVPTSTQQTKTLHPDLTATVAATKTQIPTEEGNNIFTHPDYGFSFQYPASWTIKTEKNQIILTGTSAELLISFKYVDEDVSITKEPLPSSNIKESGSINFLTQTISQSAWTNDQSLLGVFYNSGKEIKVGSMVFSFVLRPNQGSPSSSISQNDQGQAGLILASFEATFDLTVTKCTDKAIFIQDVTVLDDTRFSPGESFLKTWRLGNSGTCTWTTNYALIFIDGDQMTGSSPVPLSIEVLPGQMIDLSIELVAPASSGTYRGNWMLRNNDDESFGLGLDGDKPFWVQISVGESAPDILDTLGEPDFKDSLVSTNNWFLLETTNVKFTGGDGELLLTAINPGENDEWGLANISPLKNFYLELIFTTHEPCSGLDRYGVIARAPDPNQGYVFGFSCDGRFHLYKWDGSRYQPIQGWKNSPQIKDGPNQTNRLGIFLNSDQIKLYANGQLISEYTDSTYSEGRFGVFIGADQTQNFKVSLDEALYWKLGD
jgi:hypothetical protein